MTILSEPVRSYLENADIASAVSAFSPGKEKLPTSLRWDEMETFYRAVAAAHQVRVAWAVALHRLWAEVWQNAVADLKPVSVADNAKEYRTNTPADCWEDDGYGRCFVLNEDQWLWAEVQFDRDGTYLSVSVDSVDQATLLGELSEFEESEADDWVLFTAPALLSDNDPLPGLRAAAAAAVVAARKLVGS